MEIYGKEEIKLKKTKKILNNYNCSFCGYKFKQYVCKSGKQGKEGTRGDISDQVQCKQCGNFLKTW